jgi:hypothetical protein
MLVRPGEYLLGSWTLAKTAPTPCFPGHQVEELSLTLPPGRDIALLPRGKTIENPYLLYQSNWQRDGPVVTVRRETTVKVAGRGVPRTRYAHSPRRSSRSVVIIAPRSR